MARSSGFELTWIVPWVKSGAISATLTPRPICRGLVPPFEALGAEPMLCVCRNCVAKSTFDSLKPTVFEFATLLPTTSIVVSAACRPVRAVVIADCRPMVLLLPDKDVDLAFGCQLSAVGQCGFEFGVVRRDSWLSQPSSGSMMMSRVGEW